MTKFLITFPSVAMAALTEDELAAASADSHAVIEEAKAAGVYVFGGGIDEAVEPVRVAADGSVSAETYPGSSLTGGFLVLELPSREDAVEWAATIAAACRCPQELRAFGYDPAS
ncbi:YciI family protein [Demequina aestuarii]|uniref:YciI family protein n=1 Tax=Demequina aestuarii TaxID=327095 RepID=UPI0007827B59|nr:YciI family protein [Demequina aestuarii]